MAARKTQSHKPDQVEFLHPQNRARRHLTNVQGALYSPYWGEAIRQCKEYEIFAEKNIAPYTARYVVTPRNSGARLQQEIDSVFRFDERPVTPWL